jgi:hypothetical protein
MTLILSERPDVGSQQLARQRGIDSKAPLDQFNYVTVDGAADSPQVDEKQCRLLCDLVDGLTRTRDEAGVRITIREWTGRARSAGLDPEKVLDLFRRTKGDVHSARRDGWSWTNPDKREFVLVCIEVYSRAGFP